MNCPGIISDQQRIGHVRHFGYHVVATEVMQFVIITVACSGVGIVAYNMAKVLKIKDLS